MGWLKNSKPPKTPFSRTGGGRVGVKARDTSNFKHSKYQGANQTAVIYRQICAFLFLYMHKTDFLMT